MDLTTRTEGHWRYQADEHGMWTATDTRTGQPLTNHLGVVAKDPTLAEARIRTFTADQAEAAPAVRYSLAAGPGRAMAGHRRYTRTYLED